MNQIPLALGAMASYAQFMIYQLVPSVTRPGKTDKFPCNMSGSKADPHDAKNWVTGDVACAEATRRGTGWGVAFVLTENDPFFFIDIDGALSEKSEWSETAKSLCTAFNGAAVEVSQSGKGLHILGKSNIFPDHSCKNDKYHLECYTEKRFIALTGTSIVGDAGTFHDDALNRTVAQFFPPNEAVNSAQWTTTHQPGSCPIEDDARLIEKAMSGKVSALNVFGGTGKATFKDLWTRNVEALGESYPDPDREYDGNRVDAALAQHLLFWTGGNCERVERLMRLSALKRDKWDSHRSYMQRTITGAAARQTTYYSVGAPIEIVRPEQVLESSAPLMRTGFQFMGASQLVDHFKGCVYVAENHKILTPNGQMLNSERFNSMFGGYVFTLDDTNEKTTKKAWEAFTENQAIMFPKVDRYVFRPDIPQGAILVDDGLRVVNTYVPVSVPSVQGDVTPFLTHLNKLLPDMRDQTILMSYMAACVQFKGKKFKWAPLIQGVEGNGKTFFTLCVMMAIGERYTHMPPAHEIGEKFNDWLFDKIFIGVEDIYVPEQKAELIEILKPMITGERLSKRAMQSSQVMDRLCANFIFNSNYRNAVRKTNNDRRFAVFFTAQQEKEHLARDGMTGSYFEDMYEWARNGGYAHITHFLETYQIPAQYNPTTGCQRAPETSSTLEAVAASLGSVEQEIMEAIEEGRPGFRGGWVSSKALDGLLNQLRAGSRVPPAKRRDMMRSIGYDWHPALKDGRVNNPTLTDGGSKPRLYIREGHLCLNMDSPSEVVKQYEAAQGDPVAVAALRIV